MKFRNLLLLPFLLTSLQAASEADLTFSLNADSTEYSVSDCDQNASGSLDIPSVYNGLPVNSIGDEAFGYCTNLTSITIPDSVTSIGSYAFRDCTSLISITIPDNMTSIVEGAFYSCTSLSSITIPDSVISIGRVAFVRCYSLTSITIPDSVTSIGHAAFDYCTSLASITIPNSVTSIVSEAFEDCTSLTSITIPDSVTSIGERAFARSGLTSITIPDGVTSIGDRAFQICSNLTSITIPDSVTSIGNSAFFGTNISYDYTAENLNYLISGSGSSAYLVDGSNANGSVVIPQLVNGAAVKLIASAAFYNCTSLSSITIPDGVTSIGNYTFSGCTGLTSITIPNSVTSIERNLFANCTSLTSITIPDSVTSIGTDAFWGCTNLNNITIPDSVTSMGNRAFYRCSGLNSITIGNNVTSIADQAFQDCTSLSSITIGDSVTSIGERAFYNCYSLANVTIGNSVTSIGYYAFELCPSLTSIIIPSSVISIDEAAFGGSESESRINTITLPYKFAGVSNSFGVTDDAEITINFNDVSEGLLANTNFVAGISEEVTFDSSAIDQAIADEAQARADADVLLQANIDAVEASMQSYVDSAVAQARAEGVTAGIQSVTSDPQSYQLYSESSILEMNVSNPTLSMLNESEQAQVEFTLETSTDLEDWNIEERIQRTVEATGDKFFVRIKSGTPYVTPTVVAYNHPTYGNILTDGSGNVLYGFSIDSVGGDPLYSGSTWPLAPHNTDPEPDADVTAELTRGTYSNTSGGTWLKINNRPVYTYVGDSEPNQASGQGLGSVWFTIKSDGTLNQ